MQIKERDKFKSISHLAKINIWLLQIWWVVDKQVFTHTTGKNVELYSWLKDNFYIQGDVSRIFATLLLTNSKKSGGEQ